MPHRVDNVPWTWRPFWLTYSWLVGISIWFVMIVLHLTCRMSVEAVEPTQAQQGSIYCLWHRFWIMWGVSYFRSHRGHVWMQHPAAYMKPVHVILRLMGVRVLLGSSGEEGRQAARQLAHFLQQGWLTVISPDGPHGPAGVLKKGVLHIAQESAVPIIPVRFTASRILRLPSWDGKLVPLPFSRIVIWYGEPLYVTAANIEEAGRILTQRLGEP